MNQTGITETNVSGYGENNKGESISTVIINLDGTSDKKNSITYTGVNQTSSSSGFLLEKQNEVSINYNKPWRYIIKRRVVDG